jgi:hypothetical protein
MFRKKQSVGADCSRENLCKAPPNSRLQTAPTNSNVILSAAKNPCNIAISAGFFALLRMTA